MYKDCRRVLPWSMVKHLDDSPGSAQCAMRMLHVALGLTLNPNCQNTLGSKTEGRKESAKVKLLIKPTQNYSFLFKL